MTRPSPHPVVAARIAEQRARIDLARRWAEALAARLAPGVTVQVAVVFGSTARGDFNKWSDIDVLVVADPLPDRLLDRYDLVAPVPAGVQPVLWTSTELAAARARGNPIPEACDRVGVVVWGALHERSDDGGAAR